MDILSICLPSLLRGFPVVSKWQVWHEREKCEIVNVTLWNGRHLSIPKFYTGTIIYLGI